MRILVTGGAGFIGSHIVDRYLELGHEVLIVDNLLSFHGAIPAWTNRQLYNNRCSFKHCSILEFDRLQKTFAEFQPEVVNHHAALCRIREAKDNVADYVATNVLGTVNVSELSNRYGVKKLIFASSGGAIYGSQEYSKRPIQEYYATDPKDIYGMTKKYCEELLTKTFSGQLLVLRYSNVYGPRQSVSGEAGAVSKFVDDVLSNRISTIYGDGSKIRDFIYIDDVVAANVRSLEFEGIGSPKLVFNIGTSIETTILGLLHSVYQIQYPKQELRYRFLENNLEEVDYNVLDIRKTRNYLGWTPMVELLEGLRKLIHYEKQRRLEAVKV